MEIISVVLCIILVAERVFSYFKNKSALPDNKSYLEDLPQRLLEINNKIKEPEVKLSSLSNLEDKIKKSIEGIPQTVLASITGSSNTYKGKLGELIGYIQLKSNYDRIIPLGGIVDFVCIKFPKDSNSGQVDFVDIKTGKNAKLSVDQKHFQSILKDQNISFKTIKIDEE